MKRRSASILNPTVSFLGDLFLDGCSYDNWYDNPNDKKSSDSTVEGDGEEELDDVLSLEGDVEKVKEGKGSKILTPNKLLTRLPVLLAQMKSGNNSYKLRNKIRQMLYLLRQHN